MRMIIIPIARGLGNCLLCCSGRNPEIKLLEGETIVDSRMKNRDSTQPAFWDCGSHGLNREDTLIVKGHLLLETDGGGGY